MTDLPAPLLHRYRAEIAAEFEAYFRDLSAYLACLDDERARAFAEAQAAAEAQASLLATSSGARP